MPQIEVNRWGKKEKRKITRLMTMVATWWASAADTQSLLLSCFVFLCFDLSLGNPLATHLGHPSVNQTPSALVPVPDQV